MIVGKAFMSISYLSHVNTLISIRHYMESIKWHKTESSFSNYEGQKKDYF